MTTKQKIDELDATILKTLLKDARTSFSDIALKCGVSTALIHNRYTKLKESGIISGSSVVIESKSWFNLALAVELSVQTGHEESVIRLLKEIPNFRNVLHVVGKYDIHAIYHLKEFQEINEIRKKLSTYEGITEIKFVASNQIFGLFPENLAIQPNGNEE
ncbi:MAG: Lrp/AsnC family transcriptional regulator [Candidatus Bathyarchaeota archaeon]|nr:Lrp/AsnC family transcriptional regulator [Candidatus Bathyarchaeota archaeon]